MKLIKISERISYLPAGDHPLSADVVIIEGNTYNWIYDVGAGDEAMNLINNLSGTNNIILSHFHHDHIGNLDQVGFDRLYCGSFTKKKLK